MSSTKELIDRERAVLTQTYSRQPVAFISGEGSWLTDADGRTYLDCIGGLAVVAIGHGNPRVAVAGQSVVLRLAGDIDVSRGDLLAGTDSPPAPRRDLAATVCWLAERDLHVGARVLVQHGTAVTKAVVKAITHKLDLNTLSGDVPSWVDGDSLTLNDIGRVQLALATPLPFDPYREHRGTGAFILVDEADGWTLGAGMAGPTAFAQATSVVAAGSSAEKENHR